MSIFKKFFESTDLNVNEDIDPQINEYGRYKGDDDDYDRMRDRMAVRGTWDAYKRKRNYQNPVPASKPADLSGIELTPASPEEAQQAAEDYKQNWSKGSYSKVNNHEAILMDPEVYTIFGTKPEDSLAGRKWYQEVSKYVSDNPEKGKALSDKINSTLTQKENENKMKSWKEKLFESNDLRLPIMESLMEEGTPQVKPYEEIIAHYAKKALNNWYGGADSAFSGLGGDFQGIAFALNMDYNTLMKDVEVAFKKLLNQDADRINNE
jgi:hypothetical protein